MTEGVTELVDWLSMTLGDEFPHEVWSSLLQVPPDEWIALDRGGYGYGRAKRYGGIHVYYDGAPGMGSHCQISGTGCRELEARGVVRDWCLWAAELIDLGVKVTRIDLARDDRAGLLDLTELKVLATAEQFTSRAHDWEPRIRYGRGGRVKSHSLLFGSRTSERYMRIYDKALEQGEDGHWIRVELELRDKRAVAAVKLLAARGFAWIAGAMREFLDFKAAPIGGRNSTRVPTLGAWDAFLSSAAKVVLAVEVVKRTIAEVMYHLERQWGPMMATVMHAAGGDTGWLVEVIRAGERRMRSRHYALLSDA